MRALRSWNGKEALWGRGGAGSGRNEGWRGRVSALLNPQGSTLLSLAPSQVCTSKIVKVDQRCSFAGLFSDYYEHVCTKKM